MSFDPERLVTDRLRAIDASGIRRVFDLAANLSDPINLSIGQPDFDVPQRIKRAAIHAIEQGYNRYTVTQGDARLHEAIRRQITARFPNWQAGLDSGQIATLVTSGVSGALLLAIMTCADQGDEVLIPDPYFVMYRHLVTLAGAKAVYVDTYPDFELTAERVRRQITPRTKMLLMNSPSNPTGVVADDATCQQMAQLCREHQIMLVSDEIYDVFCYLDEPCPSPASHSEDVLLMRGFSKTYAMTGWRLGYVAGPRAIVEQMTKLQQYSFVCAPSMAQLAGVDALDVDMSAFVEQYRLKRDRVVQRLSPRFELTQPEGAFYAFVKVPEHLGLTGTQFVERAIERNVLIIPGQVFSRRDTHFRLSYASDMATLDRGLDVLVDLASA